MRYHVLHIEHAFAEPWQRDVFDQQIAEAGVDTIDGNDYYIQSGLWQTAREAIERLCAETEGVTLVSVEQCPDGNWNAAWEAEHPVQELPLGIRIVPHCAFGAGHHETTAMMTDSLIQTDMRGKRVLDHGTGTGVLAVFAKRLGADSVTAVDIDEKSVANAMENAALNGETIEVFHTSEYRFSEAAYDLVLANIHRNILLDHMHAYAFSLVPGGGLWISGFYEADCDALRHAAEAEGMTVTAVLANGEWRMMKCRKGEPL